MKKLSIAQKAYLSYAVFIALMALLPVLAYYDIIQNATVDILSNVVIYGIAALGLNILLGYSGLVSLGTAGFMGLSSYFAAYFTKDLNLPFFLSLLIAVGIPMLIGLLVGLVSLRLEGYYLAIATLGVGEILHKLFLNIDFFGGSTGRKAETPQLLFGLIKLKHYEYNSFNSMFILLIIILGIVMFLTFNIIHSKVGRAFLTMRGSETCAQAMGINLLKYKLEAFAISTLFASVAGVLFAHNLNHTDYQTWTMVTSLNILAIIVIGGMRSIFGTLIGAFIVCADVLFLHYIPISGIDYILRGALIIVIILFYPRGLVNIFHDIKRLFRKFFQRKIGVGNG